MIEEHMAEVCPLYLRYQNHASPFTVGVRNKCHKLAACLYLWQLTDNTYCNNVRCAAQRVYRKLNLSLELRTYFGTIRTVPDRIIFICRRIKPMVL